MKKNRFLNQDISSALCKIRPLRRSNYWRGPVSLVLDYLVIAAAIALALYVPMLTCLSVFVIGIMQRALATLMHDAAHGNLSKSKYTNRIIGRYFTGLLIFQSFTKYVSSHARMHHKHLGDPARDPDVMFINQWAAEAKRNKTSAVAAILKPVLTGQYLRYVLRNRFGSLKTDHDARIIVTVHVLAVLFISYFASIHYYLLFWLLPFLVTSATVGWLIELSEHFPVVGVDRDEQLVQYASRNRNASWLENLVFGIHAESYHLLHHLDPHIPFWNIRHSHNILLANSEEYRCANTTMGGILLSNNRAPTILTQLDLVLGNFKNER